MKYRVVLTAEAEAHLEAIYTYIADQTSGENADRFAGRIVNYCEALETFPKRGALRDDLHPGLRIVGYQRRVSIAFSVENDLVSILGIYYGGVDFEADFRDEE